MPRMLTYVLLFSILAFQKASATDLRITTAASCIPLHASCRPLKPGWGRKIAPFPNVDQHCRPDTYTKSLLWEETLRGGAVVSGVDESEDEVTSDDESDEDAEEEDEPESETAVEDEEEEEDNSVAVPEGEYDKLLVANPMAQMYATIGVLVLSRKIDIYNPKVVRMARYAFIGYLALLQVFLLFVRLKAKANNDRTTVSMSNPIKNMLQSQIQGQDDSNAMMKNLASSFLTSESTVLEYDLKQAKSMQGGVLFNMAFMWFLHFKMEQIQPLLITVVTGLLNLVYSPLFQVYVMGRNLERPFPSPPMKQLEEPEQDGEAASESITTTGQNEEEEETKTAPEEVEEAESEEEEEESEEEDSGDEEEESEGEASEEV